jgi:hypothetical protein
MNHMRSHLFAVALATGISSAPALAHGPRDRGGGDRGQATQPMRESDRAFEAKREGRSMPLPQLERRVLPFMGGADYLGPELNGGTYRMKFIQNGKVIWVDVDPQSGRIIRRSRP